jgi:hypothetical protein
MNAIKAHSQCATLEINGFGSNFQPGVRSILLSIGLALDWGSVDFMHVENGVTQRILFSSSFRIIGKVPKTRIRNGNNLNWFTKSCHILGGLAHRKRVKTWHKDNFFN